MNLTENNAQRVVLGIVVIVAIVIAFVIVRRLDRPSLPVEADGGGALIIEGTGTLPTEELLAK